MYQLKPPPRFLSEDNLNVEVITLHIDFYFPDDIEEAISLDAIWANQIAVTKFDPDITSPRVTNSSPRSP